jgi:hypothetical protein
MTKLQQITAEKTYIFVGKKKMRRIIRSRRPHILVRRRRRKQNRSA